MLTVSRFVKSKRAVTDFIIKMDPILYLSQTIWSSTKNLTALAMACLVDRGLLSYSDKWSQHQRQDLHEHLALWDSAVFHSDHLICIKILCIFSHKRGTSYFLSQLIITRVTKHWPEFGAQEGKELITVADVMRHEGGMPQFNQQLDIEDRCKVKTAAQ